MRFTSNRQLWIRWTALIAVGVLFVPGLRLMARQKKKTHPARKSTVHRRRRVYRHHYTRVHIQAERVRQIQKALAKAGVLHEEPNGRWDTATRDAMRQYQEQNGFSPTGLPEAKPLLKLGLGPHPLSPGLEPLPTTDAAIRGNAGTSAGSSSPPTRNSSSSSP